MHARTIRSLGGAALFALALTSCASTAPAPAAEIAPLRVSPFTPTSRVYDATRIQRSGALTAWDAVRLLVPRHQLDAIHGGSLLFGSSSGTARHAGARLVLDGHPMLDFDPLRAIPAQEVIAIHVLSASEAAQYSFGEGGRGAIVVQTHGSLRRR
jgi:hypothetical protein